MLTVDYDRLGVRAGDRLLDLGCGAGRHAFEAARRGAHVVALDRDFEGVGGAHGILDGMAAEGELPPTTAAGGVVADALALPFPDEGFDRIIAAEVLEHLPDDTGAVHELARVLRPGGTLAVSVPAWLAERVCWALSEEYHAPFVEGGHLRIYTADGLRALLGSAGLRPGASHRAHGLHSPYWWLRCAVGPTNDRHPLVRAYHRLLVWDMVRRPLATRLAERLLDPVIGKSVVLYAEKPLRPARPQRPHDPPRSRRPASATA